MATAPVPATIETTPAPGAGVRAVVSLLVILHLAAVFIGPAAMPPSSDLSRAAGRLFQPYLDVLALNNGYRFFAPEPGPSHQVRYEVTLDDGTLREGVFPDRTVHRPRLMYHRHFMLTEFVNTLEGNPTPERAQTYAKGYAQHLADVYDGKTVKLFLRRHYVPRTSEVQGGLKLDDPSLYDEKPLYTYQRD